MIGTFPKYLELNKMMKYDILVIPNFLDSIMIGIEKCEMTTMMMMMINKVNTMTTKLFAYVVKKKLLEHIVEQSKTVLKRPK